MAVEHMLEEMSGSDEQLYKTTPVSRMFQTCL